MHETILRHLKARSGLITKREGLPELSQGKSELQNRHTPNRAGHDLFFGPLQLIVTKVPDTVAPGANVRVRYVALMQAEALQSKNKRVAGHRQHQSQRDRQGQFRRTIDALARRQAI